MSNNQLTVKVYRLNAEADELCDIYPARSARIIRKKKGYTEVIARGVSGSSEDFNVSLGQISPAVNNRNPEIVQQVIVENMNGATTERVALPYHDALEKVCKALPEKEDIEGKGSLLIYTSNATPLPLTDVLPIELIQLPRYIGDMYSDYHEHTRKFAFCMVDSVLRFIESDQVNGAAFAIGVNEQINILPTKEAGVNLYVHIDAKSHDFIIFFVGEDVTLRYRVGPNSEGAIETVSSGHTPKKLPPYVVNSFGKL